MRKWNIIAVAVLVLCLRAHTAMAAFKLPYHKGQSFIVTQGYNTPPTHIKKDSYALDFTQNGCDAYGVSAVAAAPGKVLFASQKGYNGGYGTELIIDHGNNMVSRYAHLVPDSIAVSSGDAVRQGEVIGRIGDTGLVAGAACAEHPGTHLHFAVNTVNGDGMFAALDPEPISGYTNVVAGRWYLSDNGDDDTTTIAMTGKVLGAATTIISTVTTASTTTIHIPIGGVTMVADNASAPVVSPTSAPSSTSVSTSTDSVATSTDEPSSTLPIVSSTLPLAPTSSVLFTQTGAAGLSSGSWYDDNWYKLGNGFAGTLTTLTLRGNIDNILYSKSIVTLQEYKDPNYTALIQDFPISYDAPFTDTMATATFDGLSISLKPYFYYRLSTSQTWQNRSVILAGTTSTAVGTMMWDGFIYGTGRVEYYAPFFPYMIMEGIAPTSTLTPPPLTTPTDLAVSFDQLQMQLTPSFGTSTDPDWPGNPLRYEMNYSTSTAFDDNAWVVPGPFPVSVGNTYLIGVRARDSYGDVSAVATTTWNFPAGFVSYRLSPSLNYASQYFTVSTTSTLQSIEIFTTNMQTNARNPDSAGCSLAMFYSDTPVSYRTVPADNGYGGYGCGGYLTYSFASSNIFLTPGTQYQWIFQSGTGNPSTGASVQFYGTAINTAGGAFSDQSLGNAKFVVNGDSGVLFSN